jgi:hypothetical protein
MEEIRKTAMFGNHQLKKIYKMRWSEEQAHTEQ